MRHIVILYCLLLLTSCTEEKSHQDPTLIVCTTGMLGDAVMNMSGAECEVRILMGPGTDPHLFKPSKESLDLLSNADVIIANGLHLEGRMQEILEKLSRSKTVIFAADGVGADHLLYADDAMKIPDPHLWFDVSIWRKACAHIGSKLAESVPHCYEKAAAEAYLLKLDNLDATLRTEIGTIPESNRVLITAHDAFGYFGKAYGIEVLALQGISTVSEYGVRDVTALVDLITERNIKAIFTESSISPRSVEAVIAGCANKGFTVNAGGTLYSDALGPEGSGAETYTGMVLHNLHTITSALK